MKKMMVPQNNSILWATFSVNISAASVYAVAMADTKEVAYSIDSAVIISSEGPCSAKEFAGYFPLRPVRVCFLFFVLIIYTQCHRYQSSSYQFTVQVNITLHKEDYRISLQSKFQ